MIVDKFTFESIKRLLFWCRFVVFDGKEDDLIYIYQNAPTFKVLKVNNFQVSNCFAFNKEIPFISLDNERKAWYLII